ncbi:DUF6624 domain-containing protein [Sphingomonas sp. MMS12-HWE2-04]|uniref:DUF6624 domain-containing protein n=1 Tax=Sphingomonas sp. MMS12-HWE2-04 TaxID=3234199 RepID=UPI00384C35E8
MIALLSAIVPITLAQAEPAEPPPAILTPYIHDGRFDPGDYAWMRGRFDDATPEQKAANKAVQEWLNRCLERGLAQTRRELAALGVPDAKIEDADARNPVCAAAASAPADLDTRSFDAFSRDVAVARPIADSFLFAVRLAEESGQAQVPGLGPALVARTLGEQMLRAGVGWGEGESADAPPLEPRVKAIVMSRIWAATAARDRANTAWLKAKVAAQGWPTISAVGPPGSSAAWLLVQHADAEPAFQLKALRLMEPLVAKHEVHPPNFAYLYDRVMLKIRGVQRYGSQATCKDGKRVAQPLEDAAAVEGLRKEMGMEPMSAYLRSMDEVYGPCPAH